MAINTKLYMEGVLKIRNKSDKLVPFILNEDQIIVYNEIKKQHQSGVPIRIIILKARQKGITTLITGLFFKRTTTGRNVKTLQVAQTKKDSQDLFEIVKRYDTNLPEDMKPTQDTANVNEIKYNNKAGTGLNSVYKVDTAGSKGLGRGGTITNLHLSEYAFYEADIKQMKKGLFQSVPYLPHTAIIIESTANGYNHFKDDWDNAVSGKSDYHPIFLAWHTSKEYRLPYSGFTLTRAEEKLKKKYSLDNEQLEWRRRKIATDFDNDLNEFKQEYPSTPEEAFRSTGDCVFNTEVIFNRLNTVTKPIMRGEFIYNKFTYENGNIRLDNIQWVERRDGAIKIWKTADKGQRYVIGGDTAGEGSDSFENSVLQLKSGEQVATMTHLYDEDYYAEQTYCLGRMFNWAIVSPETNFSTYPIIALRKLEYNNLFARRKEDSATGKSTMQYGFKTTMITRPLIIGILKSVVNNHPELINDEETLRDMLSFIKNKNGRAEAEQNKHDDKVMAIAIAYYVRSVELV